MSPAGWAPSGWPGCWSTTTVASLLEQAWRMIAGKAAVAAYDASRRR
ncbi:hypothetical protein [Nonomuraea endophytica]|uniref:Uncharacterized protein n=1 Tax=Nonomuraea endophytica TaxID=714136 RepID=A0A7W8EF23_9ACTN|nr:hypothetical protein [Nonomuraea endophytica]MBB5076988.1 hypothetical protein [Nonomuraea endophytica]